MKDSSGIDFNQKPYYNEAVKRLINEFFDKELAGTQPVLFFSGNISQNWIVETGEMVCRQMEGESGRICFPVFVELAQNILRYSGIRSKDQDGQILADGLIYIGLKDGVIRLITGNPLKTDTIQPLTERLSKIALMNQEELKKAYRDQLHNTEEMAGNSAGLGLLDITRKSTKPPEYHFFPMTGNFSFFIMQVFL